MSLTGKILMTSDLARRYGIKDVDGKFVISFLRFEYLKLHYLALNKSITQALCHSCSNIYWYIVLVISKIILNVWLIHQCAQGL